MLLFQMLLVAAASIVFLFMSVIFAAACVWCGGGIAAINAWLQARCLKRDERAPERTPQQSLAAIYICVVQRFLVVALLFAFGLGAMKLEPLAVLSGFIVGLVVMVILGTQQLAKN